MPDELPTHSKNNLDFFRLVFAVLVIYSHSYPLATGTEAAEPLSRWTRDFLSFGNAAVGFFFITSGYLIAASWVRRPVVADYLLRRCRRIFPGYIAAAAVSLAAVALFHVAPGIKGWPVLIRQVAMMEPPHARGVFTQNPYPIQINGSLWTIRYELYCYVILMLLGLAGTLRRRSFALIAFSASLLMRPFFRLFPHLAFNVEGIGTDSAWSQFLPYFLAGVVTFLFRDVLPRRGWLFTVACVAGFAALRFGSVHASLCFPVVVISGAYAVYYLGFSRQIPFQGFGRFGDFSYGTYLYAFAIQQWIVHFRPGITPWLLFCIATPASLLAGVGSWYGVERRLLGREKHRPTVLGNLI